RESRDQCAGDRRGELQPAVQLPPLSPAARRLSSLRRLPEAPGKDLRAPDDRPAETFPRRRAAPQGQDRVIGQTLSGSLSSSPQAPRRRWPASSMIFNDQREGKGEQKRQQSPRLSAITD